MILYYIFIALLNGLIIGTSRAINARLSLNIGPFKASFWNHLVGFLFLTTVLIITQGISYWVVMPDVPLVAYFGGFFGALFVAVNSFVFPRIGATKTALLVISGQMISSVLIDYQGGPITSILAQILGICIIIFGIYLSKK